MPCTFTRKSEYGFKAFNKTLLPSVSFPKWLIRVSPGLFLSASWISPLYWALQGINNIFLRDQGWEGIWFSSMILIIFSSILLMIAYHKKKSAQGTF